MERGNLMAVLEKEFVKFMGQFDACPFEIITGEKSHFIGKGEPKFSVTVHRLPKVKSLLTSTSIALGEAYMDGDIEINGDLYETLNLFMGQMDKFYTDKWKLRKLIFTSHYDIGNDFYRLWLDETLSYSCGYFKNEDTTLYVAQCCKVERILEKLNLREGMTLCDIGCGWGFLLIQAAKKYKVREEGLEGYLEVKLLDYRDLPKLHIQFDRVVSVGMLEHVGRNNYTEFMSCVKNILKPGGLFLLHYISALKEYPGDAWVKKYIFPGGVVPSLREIINIAGDLRFYTLARMWEMYLCACAATFMNGVVDLHQVLFSNDVNNEIPMTRWY